MVLKVLKYVAHGVLAVVWSNCYKAWKHLWLCSRLLLPV